MSVDTVVKSGVQQLWLSGVTEFSLAVSDSFVPLRLDRSERTRFRAAIRSTGSAGVHVIDLSAAPHSVERTDELIRRGADAPLFKLSLMLRGSGLLVQDGREVLLAPGDLAIYDTSRPYSLLFDGPFRTLVMMFSRERFGLSPESVGQLTAVDLTAAAGLGSVISPFLAALGDNLEQFSGSAGVRLAQTTLDLASTLIAGELDSADTSAGGHRAMFAQLRRYIDANLASPLLSPATIASANFISPRHLHAIFHEHDVTVSSWIRSQRLERCRRELTDPLKVDQPVSAIAARWGFVDAAHFSRVFKAAYGASPIAVRAEGALT